MKSFIALAIASCVSAVESNDAYKFMEFVSQYGKNYNTVEDYVSRMENFIKAEKAIIAHNAK